MQVSFLHVCSAFVSWVDCGLSLGVVLCVSGHLSKQEKALELRRQVLGR